MKGDSSNIVQRLAARLPPWFGDANPVLDAVLAGLATAHAWFFSLYGYARDQLRLKSMSDMFLDLLARDFFGDELRRGANQSDSSFRNRIRIALFRERGTRQAIERVLTDLTGRKPVVIEPARIADCGALGVNLALGSAGCIGSFAMPYQAFVTVFRPLGNGAAGYPGIATPVFTTGQGAVLTPYSMIQPAVTDADILTAINAVKPVGTLVWTRIAS